MSPRLQKLATDWKTYLALLTAAGAASSLLTDVVKKATETFSVLKGLPPEARWLVAGVFLVLTVIFIVGALSRRSILLEPKRFLLSSENPEHLAGREEEVEHLARQCRRHSLVFLEGVSGSGKSSLVRAGLVPALLHQDGPGLSGSGFIPLVIDLSGLGWQRSLATALARNLAGMPEDVWRALGGGERPTPEGVFPWLAERPASAARRLLLILDQFDDYLSAHRSRFYEGTTLRRPGDIEAQNPDWLGFAKALRSGSICGLVVARSEAGGSLPALCFVEEAAIAREQLMRLPGNLVAPLLGRLTEAVDGQTVVSDPELGWLQLRSRLLRDLEASGEGQILPIQLAVALNSLRLLRYLTPSEYERNGGLRGLERLHVERHAQKAAEAAAISDAAILEALLILVNADGTKTRPGLRANFESALSRHAANCTPERAILQLEDDKLLRRVPGEGEGAETLLLYHDYLARGVREAYRQANRWTELLREKTDLFQEAIGWRQRWRALLSPVEQLRLLRERLRGGFSFAERRRFVSLSTLRWTPYLAALILAGLGAWKIDRFLKNQIAAEAMQAIGHGPWAEQAEVEQLLRLAAAGCDSATHAIRLAVSDTTLAERASTRVEPLILLSVGLDPTGERSTILAETIVLPTLRNAHADSQAVIFASTLGSHLHLTPVTAKRVAAAIVARLDTEPYALADSLSAMATKLDRKDLVPAAAVLTARIEAASDTYEIRRLVMALSSIASKLDRQDLLPAAAAVMARMKTESKEYFNLTSPLDALAQKLDRKDLEPALETLATRVKNDPLILLSFTPDSPIVSMLDRKDIVPVAADLTARIKTTRSTIYSYNLAAALSRLAAKLDRKDFSPAAAALTARMQSEPDHFELSESTEALSQMTTKLERQDLVQAAATLTTRIEAETDGGNLAELGESLGSISEKLDRQDLAAAIARLEAQIKTPEDSAELAKLSLAFASIKHLDSRDNALVGEALVARITTETDPADLASLVLALSRFPEHMVNLATSRSAKFEVLVGFAASGEWAGRRGIRPDATQVLVVLGSALPTPVSLTIYPQPVRIEQVYVDLLKSPFMVGSDRAEILKGLEQTTGQKFSNDIWAFVDWATQTEAGRALKLDLEGPPPWQPTDVN